MKRVECDKCEHFIDPQFKGFYTVTVKAKCRLGKRVMFRTPVKASSYMAQDWGGYFRYCNNYSSLSDVVSNI